MGFFSKLFGLGGAAAGEGIKKTAEGISSLAIGLRSAFTGEISPDKKAELEARMLELSNEAMKMQTEINLAEAKSSSLFVAGWRPFIGWVCGVGLACFFIPQYLFATYLWVRASWAAQAIQPYPVSAEGLLNLVIALLGLGAYRLVEKINKVQGNH